MFWMVARRPVIVMGVFRASTRNRIPYTMSQKKFEMPSRRFYGSLISPG